MVLLSIPNARWGYVPCRKITAEHNYFWDEVHFYTVVKHFPDSLQRGGVIQPHVRENKEVEVGKFLFDPNSVSRLCDIASAQSEYTIWKTAYVFLRCRYSLSEKIDVAVYGSGCHERGFRTQ